MTNAKRILYVLLLSLIISLLPFKTAFAANAVITDIKYTIKDSYITVSAALENGFDNEIIETIHSGISTTLIYEIELMHDNGIWLDNTVASKRVINNIVYSNLKNEYIIASVSGNYTSSKITREFQEAISLMSHINDVQLANTDILLPKKNYYIRVKGRMTIKKLWFPLNYLFFFVPMEDIDTSWASVKIKR